MVMYEMSFEEFQDGYHDGYLNIMTLANLNIHIDLMPSIKFPSNQVYGFWRDAV